MLAEVPLDCEDADFEPIAHISDCSCAVLVERVAGALLVGVPALFLAGPLLGLPASPLAAAAVALGGALLVPHVGLRRTARIIGVGAAAGLVAGFIAGGVGSRLAMRVVAVVADSRFDGVLTENGEVVGEITIGGTAFLFVFGSVIGLLGGIVYVAVRPWLPGGSPLRGPLFGLLLLAMLGSVVVDGGFDFTFFVSPYLAVGLFAAIYVLFGIIVAPLADRLDRPPDLPRRPFSTAGYAALAILCTIGLVADARVLSEVF